jgi:hypothetical protein
MLPGWTQGWARVSLPYCMGLVCIYSADFAIACSVQVGDMINPEATLHCKALKRKRVSFNTLEPHPDGVRASNGGATALPHGPRPHAQTPHQLR